MQINTGENKMKNEITGDSLGLSYIIKGYENTIPADQYLREVNKNSEEAIQRVQKANHAFVTYEGNITYKRDEEYYQKNKVSKLCIIDNGDGMSFNFLNDYLLKLGASTRNNKHKNWGAGFKISALPFNACGIVICSWTKESPHGYMTWIHYNDKKQVYEAKLFKKNQWVMRLDASNKPKEIKEHGTKITFLGNKKSQNTMNINPLLIKSGLFKGGRTGKANWIPSYLNTKKYHIEKNITTMCYDEEGNGRKVKGHYQSLLNNCLYSGTVQLSKASVDWFYLPEANKDQGHGRKTKNSLNTYSLTVGQFSLVHEDEVLKVDYSGKSDRNPLAAWGHQYSKYRVALILKPDEDEFRPNLERTGIWKEGVQVEEYEENWKQEWQEKTPPLLIDLESKMAKAAIEKASNFDNELKKIAELFRPEQYMLSPNGLDIDKSRSLKTGGNKISLTEPDPDPNPGPSPGPKPDKEYGEIEQELGIKIDESENKGVLTRNNPYPKVGYVEEGEDGPIATYEESSYTVDINTDSLQIGQLIEHRVKKDKINNYETVKKILLDIISFQIKQQVAHIVNITGWENELIERALSSESLSACLANKSMLLEKLDQKLKETKNIVVENNWPKNQPTLDDSFIHKNTPSKYVSNNSRK